MTFAMSLTGTLRPDANARLDPPTLEDGSIEGQSLELIILACQRLVETTDSHFSVSGFGDQPWTVDVRTDLSIVLEQLPAAMWRLSRDGSRFDLNFYEQGVERYLSGVRQGETVHWRCSYLAANGEAVLVEEDASSDATIRMLRALAFSFEALLVQVWPAAVASDAYRAWRVDVLGRASAPT